MTETPVDHVGKWTEAKLSIIKKYAEAYVKIMKRQPYIKHFSFIDGFAGAGVHVSRTTDKRISGSPAIALATKPSFSQYYFIDLDGIRADSLRSLAEGRGNVTVYEGDCNKILLEKVFPECRHEDFRRALCLLDPYKLDPNWEVIETAAKMGSIEIFLNFMISDANRNIFWLNFKDVPAAQIERMNAFWGDDSWKKIAYDTKPGLFGDMPEKAPNEVVARAYRERLIDIAGFKYVPEPIAMKNSRGSTLYYLYFASQNAAGGNIAEDIFKKYRALGIDYGQ
jgi:three-Cys-motif partner protein